MQYDASTAPFEVGDLLFIMPHVAIGGVLLFAAISGRCLLRGLSGKVGLTIQGGGGLLFFGFASLVIVRHSIDTFRCREAFTDGKTSRVEGALVITKRFVKPSHGYTLFKVGDRPFKTETLGTSCDCGFVRPLGRTVNLQNAPDVEVEVFEGAVVRLRSKGPA